ncbi:hypothetical protein BR93DRAFT_552832 [Coniochaeta sp. PMI_546]|nr:hypothetical protein BR93DRAFT_552832 [Coniochaeta sp. PMI_546]
MHQLNPRVDCLPAYLTIRSSKPTLVRGGRRPRQRSPAPGFLLFSLSSFFHVASRTPLGPESIELVPQLPIVTSLSRWTVYPCQKCGEPRLICLRRSAEGGLIDPALGGWGWRLWTNQTWHQNSFARYSFASNGVTASWQFVRRHQPHRAK